MNLFTAIFDPRARPGTPGPGKNERITLAASAPTATDYQRTLPHAPHQWTSEMIKRLAKARQRPKPKEPAPEGLSLANPGQTERATPFASAPPATGCLDGHGSMRAPFDPSHED